MTPRPKNQASRPKKPTPQAKSQAPRPKDQTPRHKDQAPRPRNQTARPKDQTARPKDQTPRPGLARRSDEPPPPEGIDPRRLDRSIRAELRSLPKDLAETVAAHLVAAGELLDTDPERAYAHAEAARRRAARLPVVREAAGEAAYAAGHYDVALNEFRTLRRMSGVNEYLPVMADCERALGRPHAALRLAQEARRVGLGPSAAVEARIVEAGARRDLGQLPEALRVLSTAVAESSRAPVAALARLHYAYADAVHAAGETDQARQEFLAAVELDAESETDAEERLAELDGVSWAIEDDPNDVAD